MNYRIKTSSMVETEVDSVFLEPSKSDFLNHGQQHGLCARRF
jgi:hypothetical protein